MNGPQVWLDLIGDEQYLKILSCTGEEAVTVQSIHDLTGIPVAACYRKVDTLVKKGLLVFEDRKVHSGGKPSRLVRSTVKRFDLYFGEGGMIIELERKDGRIEVVHLDILTEATKRSEESLILKDRTGDKPIEESEDQRGSSLSRA